MRWSGPGMIVMAVAIATPACLESTLVRCADGTFCPAGTVCGDGTCTPAEALAGCVGSPDGTPCSIGGGPGACILGVCTAQQCGDGAVTGTEQCDGVASRTCQSLGHHGGSLACGATCQFDVSGCQRCGDGLVEPGLETCDGAPATDCVERGYDLGPTSCTSLCNADLRACEFTSWQRVFTASNTLLTGVSAGPGDVLIAGALGSVARFDGTSWTDGVAPSNDRFAVVDASTTSYWLGGRGSLYRLALSDSAADPGAWQVYTAPVMPVLSLDVRHDSDVWLGGQGRALHAFDGVQWREVTLPLAAADGVASIWRAGAVAAVGMGDGKVLVSVGAAAFTTSATCAPAGVVKVWGDPDGTIGAACADGRVIRVAGAGPPAITTFPGASWIGGYHHAGAVVVVAADGRPLWRDDPYWSWIDQSLAGVNAAVITDDDVFILAGSSVYQRPRRWWTSTTTVDPSAAVSAVWFRLEAGQVVPWVATGTTLARAGRVVPTVLAGCANSLTEIDGLAGHAPGPLFAIASTLAGSALLRIDDPGASPLTLRCLIEVPQNLSMVAVSPAGEAIAVGTSGRVLIAPTAGPVRTYLATGDGLPSASLNGAWIGSAQDAWVVGNGGAVAHWDGATWTTTPPFVTPTLHAVRAWPDGEVLVVGALGTVWERHQGAWRSVPGPVAAARTLRAIDGDRRDDVWIGGFDGSLAHFNGVTWSRATLPPVAGLDIDTVQVVPGGLVLRVGNGGGSVRQLRGL